MRRTSFGTHCRKTWQTRGIGPTSCAIVSYSPEILKVKNLVLQLRYPLVAVVTNASGIPVAGVTVSFAVTAGGGTESPTSVVMDDQGVALSTLTLGPTPVTNTVTATAAGLIGSPLTFTANKKRRGQISSD